MAKKSAGLLMFQKDLPTGRQNTQLKVLLAHPGGPFFAKKDQGAWSIPKGEIGKGENLLQVAIREFEEEIGQKAVSDNFISLGEIKQKGGKIVTAWAFAGQLDPNEPINSNTFEIEWPPKSGKIQSFPEVDKAEMFDIETAKTKINPAQIEFLNRLSEYV